MFLQPEVRVQDVIMDFDFIGVTERMDESLVALQLLLGLRMGDMLSSSSKVAGTFPMAHRNMPVHKALRNESKNTLNRINGMRKTTETIF
jgi:hypothetical protein